MWESGRTLVFKSAKSIVFLQKLNIFETHCFNGEFGIYLLHKYFLSPLMRPCRRLHRFTPRLHKQNWPRLSIDRSSPVLCLHAIFTVIVILNFLTSARRLCFHLYLSVCLSVCLSVVVCYKIPFPLTKMS